MISGALLTAIVAAVAALGGSAINGAVQRAKTRSELEQARESATTAPYDSLARRVASLEDQVQGLLRNRDEDRSYIVRVLAMWSVHLPLIEPPHPQPEWFRPSQAKE